MNKSPNTEAMNISDSPSFQESASTKNVTGPASLASMSGIIAAFFASLCCIGPVVFAALGVGVGATGVLASTAGFLKALVPYRLFFIVVALATIGTGFYPVYRKPNTACNLESQCTGSKTRPKPVVILWIATVLTLVFVLSPYWLGIIK